MFFDTKTALAKIENPGHPPATSATSATQAPKGNGHVADVADVAAPDGQNRKMAEPISVALDAAMERAAIAEMDGSLCRADAEALAIAIHGPAISAGISDTRISTDNLTFELIRRLHDQALKQGTRQRT